MTGPFDPIRFTVSDLQLILFGQSSGGHNQRKEIRRYMRQMGFYVSQGGDEVENPRQFVALVDALHEEFSLGNAKRRRAEKGKAIRALSMRFDAESDS